jgi:hypothetical protein
MGIVDFFKDVSRRHEELKKRIHAFRIPLSPAGQRVMGLVYFSIPVIGGYYIMQVRGGQLKSKCLGSRYSTEDRRDPSLLPFSSALLFCPSLLPFVVGNITVRKESRGAEDLLAGAEEGRD